MRSSSEPVPAQTSLFDDDPETGDPALLRAQGAKLLRIAIDQRKIQKCAELIDAGVDLSAGEDAERRPPLLNAIARLFTEGALLLIERGAPIGAQGPEGFIPLHMAASTGDMVICRALVARGAFIDEIDSGGLTALFKAISKGNIEICRLLIDLGANVNTLAKNELTPIRAAALSDHGNSIEVLRLLTSAGADTSVATVTSITSARISSLGPLTAFQCAVAYGKIRSISFFIDELNENPLQCTASGDSMLDLAPDEDTTAVLRAEITARAIDTTLAGEDGARSKGLMKKDFGIL